MGVPPLFILLCSEQHEKIQLASMTASVAAVSERPVEVFVSMGAVAVFAKTPPGGERYHGSAFSDTLKAKNAPDALELFGQGKMLGDMKMWVCAMVLDVNGWSLDDLADDLFDGAAGLTKFLADAEAGELVTF